MTAYEEKLAGFAIAEAHARQDRMLAHLAQLRDLGSGTPVARHRMGQGVARWVGQRLIAVGTRLGGSVTPLPPAPAGR